MTRFKPSLLAVIADIFVTNISNLMICANVVVAQLGIKMAVLHWALFNLIVKLLNRTYVSSQHLS